MEDFFAVLGEERRPWLDPEKVRQNFLQRSTSIHPDRVHELSAAEKEKATEAFSTLNTAWQCLRDPKARLAHLIQLQAGSPPKTIQAIPEATAKLFMEMVELLQKMDAFLTEKARADSPMMKVQIFEKGFQWTERLNQAQGILNQRRDQLVEALKTIDAHWRPGDPLNDLEKIYHEFSYVDRWTNQLQERLSKLL